ncbi:MAG: hypothetical protein A49_29010 [Methyloceanibacter sp.]|nr:MAG: hypothetical protein A49_29010 [Methyloceanibacter sp.]
MVFVLRLLVLVLRVLLFQDVLRRPALLAEVFLVTVFFVEVFFGEDRLPALVLGGASTAPKAAGKSSSSVMSAVKSQSQPSISSPASVEGVRVRAATRAFLALCEDLERDADAGAMAKPPLLDMRALWKIIYH